MMKYVMLFLMGTIAAQGWSQEIPASAPVDDKYLEDQFYLGVTYNLLLNKPMDITQRNLSYGIMGGIIKDIPLNDDRNFGLGIGAGYALNSYYTNLFAEEVNGEISYAGLTSSDNFKRSKLETHVIEFPLEIRWRNSNATDYKFWRVYAGAKLGYIFEGRSKFVDDTGKTGFSNPDIKKLQYGLMFNVGYNTWNIHIYYALSRLLEDGVVLDTMEPIEVRPLRIGIIFYIL
ncbi:outer membrane insertion c-terminal signal protein [Sediminicola sp. YIK13]|uniref:porin family protein n=1 Tax=Sediminicola sp. YIK13 TaxID=1453352 RepID=UPI00071ECD78|nr:outer membrane insertion c-terminal signal protein [Sediminicola sp. YIK13]